MHATFRFFLLIAALCLPAAVFSACSRPTAETPYEAQLAARPDPETASSMEDSIIFEEPDSPSHNVLQELLGRPDTAAAEDINDQDIPRVALIIDDMGYHQELGEKLIELNLNLTFSFLPNAPHTRELVESAHARERDILVHLPMEPKGQQWDPGPDALMIEESSARIQEKTSTLIGLVPHAIGVNNHMGSLFTEQPAPMRDVLTVIDRHGLFFVDSFTTAQSVGFSEARAMHIPTARRHVFSG